MKYNSEGRNILTVSLAYTKRRLLRDTSPIVIQSYVGSYTLPGSGCTGERLVIKPLEGFYAFQKWRLPWSTLFLVSRRLSDHSAFMYPPIDLIVVKCKNKPQKPLVKLGTRSLPDVDRKWLCSFESVGLCAYIIRTRIIVSTSTVHNPFLTPQPSTKITRSPFERV